MCCFRFIVHGEKWLRRQKWKNHLIFPPLPSYCFGFWSPLLRLRSCSETGSPLNGLCLWACGGKGATKSCRWHIITDRQHCRNISSTVQTLNGEQSIRAIVCRKLTLIYLLMFLLRAAEACMGRSFWGGRFLRAASGFKAGRLIRAQRGLWALALTHSTRLLRAQINLHSS